MDPFHVCTNEKFQSLRATHKGILSKILRLELCPYEEQKRRLISQNPHEDRTVNIIVVFTDCKLFWTSLCGIRGVSHDVLLAFYTYSDLVPSSIFYLLPHYDIKNYFGKYTKV